MIASIHQLIIVPLGHVDVSLSRYPKVQLSTSHPWREGNHVTLHSPPPGHYSQTSTRGRRVSRVPPAGGAGRHAGHLPKRQRCSHTMAEIVTPLLSPRHSVLE